MSIKNITPTAINQLKQSLQIANKNEPGSTAWNNAENKLARLLYSFWQEPDPPKLIRLKYFKSGIFEEIIKEIISAQESKHTNRTLDNAWSLINCCMAVPDINEQDKVETLAKGVELGFIELALRELRFRPLRYEGKLLARAFTVLCNTAAYSNFTNRLISNGTPLACLELIREGGNLENEIIHSNLNSAIRTLNNLSRFNVDVVKVLPGIVDAVQPYLLLLTRDEGDDDMIMFGFRVARLLIRLYGKDDSSKVIMENPAILEFYPTFMRKLMDVGHAKNYDLYGSYWNCANITFDLSLISMSDTNKQLLVPVIPLMLEMMALHHYGDCDLLWYGVMFLSQVLLDELCLAELKNNKKRIKAVHEIISSDKEHGKETVSLLKDVMKVVFSMT
jgi:hypothetical protein